MKVQMATQWAKDTIDIRIRAAPFLAFSPHRVDGTNTFGNRFDHIQIANNALLMRNRDAKTGNGKSSGRFHPVRQLRGRDEKRQIDSVHPARLKGAIVNERGLRVSHRVRNVSVYPALPLQLFTTIKAAHDLR